MRVETIGDAILYLGDAREILSNLARPDILLTDPPYGQRLKTNVRLQTAGQTGRILASGARNHTRAEAYRETIVGDDAPFDPRHLIDAADRVLLWGAHKFGRLLPPGQMLVWDKVPNGKLKDQGCGEAAWVNRDEPLRIHRRLWDGLSIAGGYETRVERTGAAAARRVHPTQKPVDLMAWCLSQLGAREGEVVLDPYMGGGSTGIAALLAGCRFVGVEIEPAYFDAACRRIEQAARHLDTIAGKH